MKNFIPALLLALPIDTLSQSRSDTFPRLASRQVLTMKATGETVQLVTSGKETNGAYAEFIITLPASKPGPPVHRHPLQSEYFEAIEGTLGLMADGKKITLRKGESFTVQPGVKHTFFNDGPDTAKWKGILRPALNFEYLSDETIAAVNRAYPAMPSSWELLYILSQAKGEYYLADVSMFKQKITWPLKAWWGRLTGKTKLVRPLRK